MTRPLAVAMVIAACGLSSPAVAQVMVYDAKSYASLIRQASTALDQLNALKAQAAQAKALYEGFNTPSGVGSIARQLGAPALRAFIPDADVYISAAQDDLGALGQIGQKAKALRRAGSSYTPSPSDLLGQELEKIGDRAARDLAMGQQAASIGAQRLEGLQQLAGAIDTAPNVRAVADIHARIAAEQAMISNDLMRLEGLAMAQDAQARLQAQQDQERARAASDARLASFRKGFP
jgi:type IV secretion system protein VirB5